MKVWKVQVELIEEYEDILAETEEDAIEQAWEAACGNGAQWVSASLVDEEMS